MYGLHNQVIAILAAIGMFFERDRGSRAAGKGIADRVIAVVGRLGGFKPYLRVVLSDTFVGESAGVVVNFKTGVLV